MSEIANDVKFSTIEVTSNLGVNFSANNTRIKHTGSGELTMSSTVGDLTFTTGGTSSNALTINAPSGGIDINAGGKISIDTTSVDGGIHIATSTAGIPVIIGTSTTSATIAGDLVVSGNLIVNGDSVTNNVITYTSEDSIFYLNSGQTGTSTKDIGLIGERGSASNVAWVWDESADEWVAAHTNTTEADDGIVNILNYNQIRCGGLAVVTDVSKDTTTCDVDVDGEINLHTSEAESHAIDLYATAGGIRLKATGHNVNIDPSDANESASTSGHILHISSNTVTDSSTSSGGTTAVFHGVKIEAPTLAAVNDSVTTTTASTLYISGAPSAGGNQTLTHAYALNADGFTRIGGPLLITGSVDILSSVSLGGNLDMNENNIVNNGNLATDTISPRLNDITINVNHDRPMALEIRDSFNSYILIDSTSGDECVHLNSDVTLRTGEAITISHAADANGEDLTIAQTGNFNASLLLTSTGTGADAIGLTANAGGIDINAGTGGITIDTTGSLSLDSSATGASSNLTHVGSTGNDLTVSCTSGSLNLLGGEAVADAVRINTTNTSGGIDIDAGTRGLAIDTTGSLSLDSSLTTGPSNLTHVGGVGHDLTVECVSGSLNLISGEAHTEAIKIEARDDAGGIKINSGTGGIDVDTTGYLYINTGSGGIDIISDGYISLNSNTVDEECNLTHAGGVGNDLLISCTLGSLNLRGGEAAVDAVRINTTHLNGGIDIDAGTGGIAIDTTGSLSLDSSATSASSNLTHVGSAGNDLTVSCTSGSLNLLGGEAINNAVRINTTNAVGGIDIDAGTGGIAVDSTGVIDINATGALTLDSSATGASSNLTHVGSAGNDLTVSCTSGSLNLLGGEAINNAVRINTTNAAGGIDIDAGTGGLTIDTTGTLSLDSSATTAPSNLTHVGSAGNDLTVSCTSGSLNLIGGEAINNAVTINTTNVAGGIDIDAGTGGIAIDTTGPLSLDSSATGAGSNLTHVGSVGNDLTVSCGAGSLLLRGGEAAVDAVRINAFDTAGGIDIDAGTGGLTIDTTGSLSLDSSATAAPSNLTHVGSAGNDLTVSCTSGSLNLIGGEAVNNAVTINTTNVAGGIDIDAGTGGIAVDTTGSLSLTGNSATSNAVRINSNNAAGGIDIDAGTGGVAIDTTGSLSLDSSATGASSNLTHVGSAGNDLTVSCTAGSLNLIGGEAINNAVRINTTNAAGGIDIDAGTGGIAVDSTGVIDINATGALTLDSSATGASSNLTHAGSAGNDLTVSCTSGSLNLLGGEAINNAVRINTTNAAGGIDIDAGTGGLTIDTTGTLSLDSSATGASSNLTHVGSAGNDLTVSCTSGSLNLIGGEAINNAVTINTTNAAGGIDIDAGTGGIAIDTTGPLSLDSSATGASSNLTHVGSAGNDLTVSCTSGSLNLLGGEAINNAVRINTTNVAGGIDIDAGTGGIAVDSTGVIDINATGALTLDSSATGASSNLTHAGSAGNDLTVSCTSGSVNLRGGEAAVDAVKINTTHANGGIDIDAGTGGLTIDTTGALSLTGNAATNNAVKINSNNAAGGIDIDSGTGGITIDTTGALDVTVGTGGITFSTSGTFSIDSTIAAGASNITHIGASGQDLTVSCTNGSLILAAGENVADAVRINASDTDGGIDIDAGSGGITIDTTGPLSLTNTTSGITIDTSGTFSIDSSTSDGASNVTHVGSAGNDLTVSCTGGSLNLLGGEAINNAVRINTINAAGGIDIDAGTGGIAIDTTGSLSLTGNSATGNAVRINSNNAAGGIDIDAGTGGIAIDTTGALSLDSSATTASSNLTHAGGAGHDLTVSCTNGSLNLTAGEAANNAITITAGAGGIDINASTGGITIDTSGAISIDSEASGAPSNLTHVGSAGNDLTVSCTGGSLNLRGGEAAADAVRINTINAAGGIDIDGGTGGITIDTTGSLSLTGNSATGNAVRINSNNAAGGIDIDAGTGGIAIDTTGSLSLDSSATGASSNLTHVGSAGNDLTVSCTNGSLNLTAGEAANNAITITAGAGGIDINASTGGITIDTSGAISIDSEASGAPSNLTHVGSAGNDLTVSCTGGSLNLRGGEAVADAVRINTINAAGGIDIDGGSAGITIDTTGSLSLDSSAIAASSNLTHAGGAGHDLTVSCTNGSLNLTAGEAANNAIAITASAGGITMSTASQVSITGDLLTTSNTGATGTNVTAVEHGTSRLHLTVLTLTNVDLGAIASAADQAKGVLIYTLPAGAIIVKHSYMSVGLTNADGTINGDTPDIGLGTAMATGAVNVLGGTPQFEDVLVGQTAANVTGTATVKTTIPQLIIESGDDHTIYLNIADGWAGSDTSVKANGSVVLEWTYMEGTVLG
uniref:S-layer family protein n=1 Tax=viral metagenome TaxID=1070528 RepID=A0A6C0E813_9ZZZZ